MISREKGHDLRLHVTRRLSFKGVSFASKLGNGMKNLIIRNSEEKEAFLSVNKIIMAMLQQ